MPAKDVNPYGLDLLPFNEPDLRDQLAELIGRAGWVSFEQVVERLSSGDASRAEDLEDVVLEVLEGDDLPVYPADDDRWVHLPWLLADRVFTHRLADSEVEHDVLASDPDLSPVQLYADHPAYSTMAGHDGLIVGYPDTPLGEGVRDVPYAALAELGSLVLPAGTLAGLGTRAGDLVAVSLRAGRFVVTAVDDLAEPLEAARAYALEFLAGRDPVEADDLLLSLLLDVPDLFTEALPPVGELFEAWGIGHWNALVAEPGFDWELWRRRLATDAMVQRYDLTDEEAAAVQVLVAYVESVAEALDAIRDGAEAIGADPAALTETETDRLFADSMSQGWLSAMPDPDQINRSLPYLADPHLTKVLLAELDVAFDGQPSWPAIGAAAEGLREQADRHVRPALHWLQATAYDRLGNLTAAEEQLRASERLDPDFYPTLVDLARLANDRGNASTALALLARVPDEVAPFLRGILAEVRPQPTRLLPRNAPCWCGSGRKFKQCHLRQPEQAPLADRTRWLYGKGIVYALESGWGELIALLTEVHTAGIASEELVNQAVKDGLVLDVALFEGGAFAEYVASRQHVLPPDELLLAQQWLLTERSAYEVTGVDPGVWVTFRDLRTGDELRAADRLASGGLQVGQLVCSHLLPQPDGTHAIHTIDPIELHQRSRLLELLDADEPNPFAVVALLSSRLVPPAMVNTEGHPLVICEVTLSSPDPAALATVLDAELGPAETGEDGPFWVDHVEVDGEQKIRAMVTLAGDAVTLTTNSVERRDLVLARLRDMQPGLVVEEQHQERASDLLERSADGPDRASADADRGAVGAFGQPVEQSPEEQAVVAEYIRGYEERWLDLDIPALDGLTPRQAAADPTRRDDLLRLLASFPESDDPTQMSPVRLRQALAL